MYTYRYFALDQLLYQVSSYYVTTRMTHYVTIPINTKTFQHIPYICSFMFICFHVYILISKSTYHMNTGFILASSACWCTRTYFLEDVCIFFCSPKWFHIATTNGSYVPFCSVIRHDICCVCWFVRS